MLVVVAYQNRDKIENFAYPSSAVTAGQAKAKVTLYATDWCGYCKQTRRFLESKGIPSSISISQPRAAERTRHWVEAGFPCRCEWNIDQRI